MSARILIVDDVPANVKLLAAKLSQEYYDVISASDGPEALEMAERESPDLILLDVMMPGMSGFEVCERLKKSEKTTHIPVVMVTALSDSENRVRGLDVGADDFLTKPVKDVALFARVRSLIRLKFVADEWRLRRTTSEALGVNQDGSTPLQSLDDSDGQILLVEEREDERGRLVSFLESCGYRVTACATAAEAALLAERNDFDVALIADHPRDSDGLRLSSQLRSRMETRQLPLIVNLEHDDYQRAAKALELGVNDYIFRPIDRSELRTRLSAQIRRKRYQDGLKRDYEESLSLAFKDSLTGLFNRRYLDAHLERLLDPSASSAHHVGVLIFDIDHFKEVNDRYGHGAGDYILCELSRRIQRILRNIDMIARLGGEEFVIVLPDADQEMAMAVAERVRQEICKVPFSLSPDGDTCEISVSVGVVVSNGGAITPEEIIKRADTGLYEAKRTGRNRVHYAMDKDGEEISYFATTSSSGETGK